MQHIFDSLILKKKMKIFAAAMLVLAVVYFGFIAKKSKADEVVFFPQTCEGTWLNVDKVTGDPEEKGSLEGAKTVSAGDQITCYNFEGSLPEGAIIKESAVEFIWGIDDQKNPIIEPSIEESYDPSPSLDSNESVDENISETDGTSTDIIPTLPSTLPAEGETEKTPAILEPLPVIKNNDSVPAESPIPTNEPTSLLPRRLQSLLLPIAQAQEEVINSTPEASVNLDTSENLDISEPITPLSEEIITSEALPTETVKIDSDLPEVAVNNEQNDIFDVRYGLGENEWQGSGRLSREQLSKPTALTLTAADILILKVSLSTRLTLEPLDNLVLKGVKLIVSYEETDNDDPIKQPNLKVDTILDDVTVDGVRAIRIKRVKSKTQEIWYQTVKNNESSIKKLDPKKESDTAIEILKSLPSSPDITNEILPLSDQGNIKNISDTEKVVISDSVKADLSSRRKSDEENLPPTVTKKSDINKGSKNVKADWNLVATNEWIHENSPLGLRDGLIFWFSKEGTALYSFNILTQGMNTQSYQPEEGLNYIRYINPASKEKKAILDFSNHTFIFTE